MKRKKRILDACCGSKILRRFQTKVLIKNIKPQAESKDKEGDSDDGRGTA